MSATSGTRWYLTSERTLSRKEFCQRYGLDPSSPVIALLPGSRAEEVANILPTLIGAAQRLGTAYQFVVSAAPNIADGQIQTLMGSNLKRQREGLKIVVLREDLYDALRHSAAAAVCSGTATLESASIGTPFVMVYRIAPWRWALRHLFVRVPHYCIVNLIAGRRVVAELMQDEFTPERTAMELGALLNDARKRAEMTVEFTRIRDTLDRGNAFKSAALAPCRTLGSDKAMIVSRSTKFFVIERLLLPLAIVPLRGLIKTWRICLPESPPWRRSRRPSASC